MSVRRGFILAAGFGTRMGSIGKLLPKPLWPVFEKSLIELQINYLKQFGISEFYANVHHMGHLLDRHVQENKIPLNVLHEEEILDVGGGIINLSKKSDGDIFFIQNVDQFLFFRPSFFDQAMQMMTEHKVVLFAIKVKKPQGYNKLMVDRNGALAGIEKWHPNISQEYYTYAGCSLVETTSLQGQETRKVNFFESVADFTKQNVGLVFIDEYEYWDFGTAQSYFDNHMKILQDNGSHTKLFDFILSSGAINKIKMGKNAYGSLCPDVINLTHSQIEIIGTPKAAQIHLTPQKQWSDIGAILYEDLSSPVSLDQMTQV